jgi:hypothetical protein
MLYDEFEIRHRLALLNLESKHRKITLRLYECSPLFGAKVLLK